MDDLSLPEVRRLVAAANAVRQQRDTSGSAMESDDRCAERQLDALFRTSHTLAVYGRDAKILASVCDNGPYHRSLP
jgi:hypothetical protein